MDDAREINESPLVQGADEIITYQLTTTPWGSTPSSISVKAYKITGGGNTDVTSTVLSGSAAAVGDVITLPILQALTKGEEYQIEIKFSVAGNTLECYMVVDCN